MHSLTLNRPVIDDGSTDPASVRIRYRRKDGCVRAVPESRPRPTICNSLEDNRQPCPAGYFYDFAQKIDLKILPSLLIFYPMFLLVLGLQMPYVDLHKVPSVFPEESTKM